MLKFISADNYNDKFVVVILKDTKSGKDFIGVSECSPGDNFNEIFGGRMAECRAYAKYLKYREQEKRKEFKNYKQCINSILPFVADDEKKHIYRILNGKEKELKNIQKQIDKCYFNITKMIYDRDKFLYELDKKKKNKVNN